MKLIYLANRWPNPSETAAATRSFQVIDIFREMGYEIRIASFSPADHTVATLKSSGIECIHLKLNDSSLMEHLATEDYDIAVFDTFLMEEKLSWMFCETLPECMTVLDLQDVHSLRYARAKRPSFSSSKKALDFDNEITYREMASIYRSDLTLVISYAEVKLLKEDFNIDHQHLLYLPFLFDPIDSNSLVPNTFDDRNDLLMLGNFLHKPNLDQVKFTINELYGALQASLPDVVIKIIGAYPPQQLRDLAKNKKNVQLLGYQEDLKPFLDNSRLMIAPLRFGAGLKGKLFDAMRNGLPFVASEVASEGILGLADTYIPKSPEEFIDKSVNIYTSSSAWRKAQFDQHQLLHTHFAKQDHTLRVKSKMNDILSHLTEHRKKLFFRNFLEYHQLRSTEYFSKWLELKNGS